MLTVGEILKKERIKKNISLEEIEKITRIRKKYLQAIEENNWSYFSSKIYINGIIKNYAKILNLNTEKVLAIFRRDYGKKELIKFKKRLTEDFLNPTTKKIFQYLIIIIFGFFFLYFIYQLKLYLSPPNIKIIEPKVETFKEEAIKIVGKVDKEVVIYIFNQRVYQDNEGVFEYLMPLKKGENQLIITIIGANGKKNTLKKVYIRK